MKLYVPSHLKKLKVVEDLCRMIGEYSGLSSENSDPFYYYYKQLIYDPVKRFVGICLATEDSGEKVENIINYLTSLFYGVKGCTKVFDYLVTHLGIEIDELNYDIKTGSLSINLKEVPTTTADEELFRKTFEDFLKSLLYVNKVSISIEKYNLTIERTQNLIINTSLKTFKSWDVEASKDDKLIL